MKVYFNNSCKICKAEIDLYKKENIKEINWVDITDNLSAENVSLRDNRKTLIQSISLLGLEDTLDLINGMFSFALWDREEKTLILARDRLGEKPLFYGMIGQSFVFGSELKCFKSFPDWQKIIDQK